MRFTLLRKVRKYDIKKGSKYRRACMTQSNDEIA